MAGWHAAGTGVHDRVTDFYSVAYLLDGHGYYESERHAPRLVGPGDLLFVFPGVRHSYAPLAGATWAEEYLVFEGPIFGLLREVGVLDEERPVRRLLPLKYWSDRLREFRNVSPPLSERAREVLVCRFVELLAEIAVEGSDGAERDQEHEGWLERARALLETDIREERSLEQVALDLGLSYGTFRKRFRRATGVSPGKFRAQSRAKAARQLLLTTSLTNAEIAESLGFVDESYFSKRVKQLLGQRPSALRERPLRRRRPRAKA